MVKRTFRDNSEFGKAMFAAQEAAREQHLNIWRYGEVAFDDEKDN